MITHAQAAARRDTGMQLAVDNANRERPGWSDDAYTALEKFCLAHEGQRFLAEEVRAWGEEIGLIEAPRNAKSWGHIMRKASRLGLIRSVGAAPAKSSNLSFKTNWEAV
jgi:hypothetical protein